MILRILAILFVLACGLLSAPTQAATYTMAAGSRPTCSSGWSVSGSTYTCPPGATVTLNSGDTIVPASAITIVVNAGIILNGNNTIGSASVPVNLTTTSGNLTTTGTSTVYGNLTTSSGAVSLTGTTVNGTVTTSGTLNTSGGQITGNVSANNGVTSTNGTVFGGSVTVTNGTTSFSNGGSVAGNVTSSGNLTATGGVVFSGNVTATNGTLTLTNGGVAGAVRSNCCVVSTANTNVSNGVSSGSSTVNINGGTVSGPISTSGGSGIIISNATVSSGTIAATNVPISISNSTIGTSSSPVPVSSNNTVTITSSTVYGNVTAATWQNPITVVDSNSIVHGTCDSQTNSSSDPGSYSNRCDGGVTGSTTTVKFNACHNYSSGNCEAVSGRLYTRLVGTVFSVDVVALKSDGSVDTSFDKKATVSLIARSAAGSTDANKCFDPEYSQTLDNAATAFTSGRLTIDNINVTSAYPDVRINVSCDSANCATPIAAACSTDNFAIRPVDFTVTSSNANADGNGSSTTATPTVKAGAPFSLTAETVAGYNGRPEVNPDLLSAHSDAVAKGAVSGSFSPASNGTATGNAFTYSEVGYFRFSAQGVYDYTFTDVDQNQLENDCTNDYSNMLAGGKYGCKFGNIAETAYFGRFVPDHFAITPGTLTPRCGTFTYFGQDGFSSTAFILTAQNSSNATTKNYAGSYAKLALTTWANFGFTVTNPPAGSVLSKSDTVPEGSWSNGVATVTARHQLSRPTVLTGETNVVVRAAPTDSDGVTMAASDVGPSTPLRYGRLTLQNAYGSELLALPMSLTAEYWNGTSWVTNAADNCTELTAPADGSGLALNLVYTGTTTSTLSNPLDSGDAGFSLAAPGATHTGFVSVVIDSPAWLDFNWDGVDQETDGNLFDDNPTARATFGIYKGNSKFIYIRELFY